MVLVAALVDVWAGRGDQQQPARAEHAVQLAERALTVAHVLDRLQADDQVEALLGEGKLAQVAGDDLLGGGAVAAARLLHQLQKPRAGIEGG
jgi:hypothetical protein